MRQFTCERCGQLLFFENSVCLRCGANVGFTPDALELVVSDGARHCANHQIAECNWLVRPQDAAPDDPWPLCFSCGRTDTRPPDSDADGMREFAIAEAAKRRLFFQLLDIGLPIRDDLRFDLLSSTQGAVTTGHDAGRITIDLAESDDARREARRQQLAEPYRTMLGHFRHEVGHYYEPILVDETGHRDAFRAVFGDERADYSDAIDRHYESGPPADWAEHHVSAYATMHPWEDWAETWAHYLHIRDTLQTAGAFGMSVQGPAPSLSAAPDEEAEGEPFGALLAEWLPLTYALNQVNRSMGKDDLYPFTLAPTVIEKLTFVHDRVEAVALAGSPAAG